MKFHKLDKGQTTRQSQGRAFFLDNLLCVPDDQGRPKAGFGGVRH
jgi:hypothetical protein